MLRLASKHILCDLYGIHRAQAREAHVSYVYSVCERISSIVGA
jgi:hypothetical protein